MKTNFLIALLAAGSLALPSCMTTYDHTGRPVQSVDPGLATVGIIGAGLIGASLASDNNHNKHYRSSRSHYRSPHKYRHHGHHRGHYDRHHSSHGHYDSHHKHHRRHSSHYDRGHSSHHRNRGYSPVVLSL